ncbi:MAG: hypothetical protein KDD61_08845 [Bdellovibrionales bacterium]|nr:hypothetical protein [Bdellovibrionales bacterium]
MNQPNVKNEGFFVWLKGAFSSSVAEDAQAVMNDIRKDGGIPISSAIPKEIRESFTFGDVIYRQNTVGIPMNLNERNNRVLLK